MPSSRLRVLLVFIVVCGASHFVRAQQIPRISGILGKSEDGRATFEVTSSEHHGTYVIARDIKGLAIYPGTHIVALDAGIRNDTIDFQKFEWERLDDFILSDADLLTGWELPARFGRREISGAALKKLPAVAENPQEPVRGVAQRLTVHVGSESHAYQIRYYEFRSPSAAALFAERWSAKKGVTRDPSEHFRRAFEKYGVWVVNADDERLPPDYWVGRFILESLSRKTLITLDTSIIFNRKNADVVIFNASADTCGPGDTLVLYGQGFSPFLWDNSVTTLGDHPEPVRLVSATSHQLTIEVPRSLGSDIGVQEVQIQARVHRYALTNPITIHVRK